jgi:aminopeptidase
MDEKIMRKYAKLAVTVGVNVQKGQLMIISAAPQDYKFVRVVVEEGYKAGAGEVVVKWSDEITDKLNWENMTTEQLSVVPEWVCQRMKYEQDRKCCYLHVISGTPGILKDIDHTKLSEAQKAIMQVVMPYQEYTMASHGQWSIVALPSPSWAKIVFPNDDEQTAMKKLEEAILKTVYISEDNDNIADWNRHSQTIKKHCDILNSFNLKALHFTNSKGTDLTVQLVKTHIWCGGSELAGNGVTFDPNMPTEECFCMPHKDGVDGIVYSAKPLNYKGKLINDFWLKFENGRVVDYDAAQEKQALTSLLDTDEGSRHLGEVALISYHSPISLSGILYYNTLFDENASCHLALGRSYPTNIKGGAEMTEEQMSAIGANMSMNHCDFMFGTEDMKVVGIKQDGQQVVIFESGDFAI